MTLINVSSPAIIYSFFFFPQGMNISININIYRNVRNELAVGLISLIIFFTGEMGILCNALQKIK